MARYLDPKYDLTFKRLFAEHDRLCISLLNSMLPFKNGEEITEITYQTGELILELPALRNSIVDLRCTDSTGRQFLVEMQMDWTSEFKDRVLLNASKAYVMQLDRGQEPRLLQPVFSLNFLNQNLEKSMRVADDYYHHYKIVNIKDTNRQIKGLEFIFIELQQFKPQNRATGRLHELWLRFLTEVNENMVEAPPEFLADENLREAMKLLETGAYSKEQLIAYDMTRLNVRTASNMFDAARKDGRADGLDEGLAKGKAEGLAEGKAEGLAEGKATAARDIALNLLKKGLSMDDIVEITGLPPAEIQKLKK